MTGEKETTVLDTSVGAEAGQPLIPNKCIIPDSFCKFNRFEKITGGICKWQN